MLRRQLVALSSLLSVAVLAPQGGCGSDTGGGALSPVAVDASAVDASTETEHPYFEDASVGVPPERILYEADS